MLYNLPLISYFRGGSLDLFSESVPQANASIIGTLHDLTQIGRVRKIAVEKGRPSTSQLITGVPPVTFSAGSSESDHSCVLPVKIRWSGT